MTSKEALEVIEDIYEHEEGELRPYDDPIGKNTAYKEEFDILRKLVERDTPMKAIDMEVDNLGITRRVICPACRQWSTLTEKEIFCPKCGQRLEENENDN